jgi:hypothetical protein
MKPLFAVAVTACLLTGCSDNYDGRYPIDTMTMRTEGSGHAELANQTFPLNAWFEIESGVSIRIHDGGVTSVYPRPTIMKTMDGFEAVSDDPHGNGQFSWSFERGDPDGFCSLTLTYDGVQSLVMLSKGKESR